MTLGKDARLDALLADLNEPQRQAVTHGEGPLLILAGPGSGKTRVVTRRAAYLAATLAEPYQILAITFTNKAAAEMRERIAALGAAEGMTIATFHALCARLLRIHHDAAGVPQTFSILDREDRRKVIKQAVEECGLSGDNWPAASLDSAIGDAKNAMLSPAEFAERETDWRSRTIARVYEQYERILAETGCLDFDDLLLRVARLLNRDEGLRQRLEDRYRFVLVDEYQDTNEAQYAIARLLTHRQRNLCATGDPDQSIYGWRGANIKNILSFEQDYPDARVVRLEQNYRSTQRILSAADLLIGGNLQRKAKTLWTENEPGSAIRAVECETSNDEAAFVARDIAGRVADGCNPGGIAVFYRINSLSRSLEEAFRREGLRYQIARGVEFYNRKEVKDTLAYLRVIFNPADEVALLRIINTPARGIGATTVKRVVERARATEKSVLEVLADRDEWKRLGRAAGKLEEFAATLSQLGEARGMPPGAAIDWVLRRSGLRAMYSGDARGAESPGANLDELVSAAAGFQEEHPGATLLDWLEYTALVSDVDSVDEAVGSVTLMTLHAAKGLEFDTVYIVGLEDGLLPFRREGDDSLESDREEERRLCFVGMTRARKSLTLTFSRYRMLRGSTVRTVRSPFLDELPRDELEWTALTAPRARRHTEPDRGRLPADIEQWGQGTLVSHPLYGLGRVMSLYRSPSKTHVDVLFQSGKRRTWILEFSDLRRVDFDEVGETA